MDSVKYACVFDTPEAFVAHYKECYCVFVYDCATQKFYTDFTSQDAHATFMARLYTEQTGDSDGTIWQRADKFISEARGIFLSRAGTKVTASQDFILPNELRFLRRDMEYI